MMPRFLLLTLLAAVSASAIEVKDAWVQAVPPGSSATAAFMTIVNDSDETIALTGGTSAAAGTIAPMITTRETVDGQEVMGMAAAESLEIAPGATRQLQPGGDHLMLLDMSEVPKAGTTIEITLTFKPGGAKTVTLPVAMRHE